MQKPTRPELDQHLKDVVKNWKRFALHLPGMDSTNINTIELNKRDDVVEQKIAVYDKWLQVCPSASWDDVIKALEIAEENTIAKELREKYPAITQSIVAQPVEEQNKAVTGASAAADMSVSRKTTRNTTPTPTEVPVSEDIVKELNTLHRSFKGVANDVETGVEDNIKNGKLTIEKVTRDLKQDQAFSVSLDSVTTADKLFDAIRPHCNFLNCYLIVSIACSFLSKAIAEKASEYEEKIGQFMKTTKIRSLQNALKPYSRMSRERSNTTSVLVEIVVVNGWGDQKLWLVKTLLKFLFGVKHPDELPWCDIVPGSVVMTFIALEHMTPSFIESSRKKTEFMRLIGVISLKIGDELVWKKEGNKNPFSFEDGLIQATVTSNIETAQFLLQYTQLDVNTKNTTNTLINAAGNENIYWNQEYVKATLQMHYAAFTAALEQELQYLPEQMTVIDDDSNSSSPDGSSKSTHRRPRDNFLNVRVLAGLSDQLPEPISTQVKQYQATLDGLTKRKSLLIYLSSSLENCFPTPFPDSIEVILSLHSVWRVCSVWYVEQLGQLIFTPTLFHNLQWFRVNTSEESLRVAFLADKELMDSLKEDLAGSDESQTSLLGVISIRVDDTVVISNDYSNGYTFNEGMERAKAIGNDEISDLLLQILQSPVEFARFGKPDNNNNYQFLPEPDSTPLMIACCNNNSQLVQLFLDHDADPNIQTRHGFTALMCSTVNSKIFQMLLDHGADIETCTFLNDSVLNFACWTGNEKIVKTIIAVNYDLVHLVSNNGWTALKTAYRNGHTAVVKLLLQAKADPNTQAASNIQDDAAGWTAIVESLRIIRAERADVDEQTALELALENNNSEIAEKLRQAMFKS